MTIAIQELEADRAEDLAMTTSVNLKKLQEPSENHPQDHERLRFLAQLADSVSHAVHNPLTSIFLHADILEDELRRLQGDDSQQSLDSLRLIREEVTRMHDLVEQYLMLTRLSVLSREPMDLGAFLEAFVIERQERLAASGIAFRLEETNDLGLVAMHQKAFERALLNVLEHAVEGMPEGGSITLRARRTAAGIQIHLSHTGDGTPSEQLSQRLSAAECGKSGRMGLGLYLVKEIMTAHGGILEVASEPDVGTTFTVTLPPVAS
jgi:signal transduction histidine kinase